ncbi:hypothetical protein LTR95_000896 [Oleoguttula sp. CCFEE 5521]
MSHGTSLTDLRALIVVDITASNSLQARIAQLEDDLAAGKSIPDKKVNLMERSNKDIVRDLVARLEQIEGLDNLTATDREMMQALNARLAVCDLHAMRLAKLRDLEFQARGTQEFLEAEALPAPRSKSKSTAKPQQEDLEPLLRPATPEEATQTHTDEDEEADEELPTSHHTAEDGEEEQAEAEEEAEPDKSTWPLLYQIIDRLARRNNPKFLPNDADAPRRWAAVIKAHETLMDPERKRFYDMRNKTPVDLEGFDLSSLRSSRSKRAMSTQE